jgi:hypothetical protein
MAQPIKADLNAFRGILKEAVQAKKDNKKPDLDKVSEIGVAFINSFTPYNESEIVGMVVQLGGEKVDASHAKKALRDANAFKSMINKLK